MASGTLPLVSTTLRGAALALALALTVALVTPTAVQASYPVKRTTYQAVVQRGDQGLEASIKIVIGADRTRVAKVVVKAACEGDERLRIVRRNVPIDRVGGFSVTRLTSTGEVRYAIDGAWETKRSMYGEVDLSLDECAPGGFGFTAAADSTGGGRP